MYGNKLKRVIFRNTNKKYIFSRPFFKVLNCIELYLKVFVLRLSLVDNLIKSKKMINQGLIQINGSIKSPNYIIKVGDFIQLLKTKKIRMKSIRMKRYC